MGPRGLLWALREGIVATIEDLRGIRWRAINPGVPLNTDAAIYQYWLQHPEIGSPLGGETELEDGSVGQAFANGIVLFRGGELEVVT
jgi:hypothetical protein